MASKDHASQDHLLKNVRSEGRRGHGHRRNPEGLVRGRKKGRNLGGLSQAHQTPNQRVGKNLHEPLQAHQILNVYGGLVHTLVRPKGRGSPDQDLQKLQKSPANQGQDQLTVKGLDGQDQDRRDQKSPEGLDQETVLVKDHGGRDPDRRPGKSHAGHPPHHPEGQTKTRKEADATATPDITDLLLKTNTINCRLLQYQWTNSIEITLVTLNLDFFLPGQIVK
jgi:hypothetical protein